jgi:hypothetical protein
MESMMEADVLRVRPLESQASSILQRHFMRRRQTPDPVNLTHEIKFIATCALQWCPNSPVLLLKTIGILFFDGVAAFNLSLVSGQLILCRARAIAAFHREGWQEIPSYDIIATVVGANEVKHWSAMAFPAGTELAEFLTANPQLIASQQSFGLDRAPEEVLIGPGLPPKDVISEPHFPLVSIMYQQLQDKVQELVNVAPTVSRVRKMEYCLTSQITID